MSLTEQQVTLISESWDKVMAKPIVVAMLFYDRLFEIDLSTRPLFSNDIQDQGEKLVAMISTVVVSLNKFEALIPALRELGERHVNYGVTEKQYDSVGAALLWTLEQGLEADFTDDVKAAWTQAYQLIVSAMLS